jgi:hypothetical protein
MSAVLRRRKQKSKAAPKKKVCAFKSNYGTMRFMAAKSGRSTSSSKNAARHRDALIERFDRGESILDEFDIEAGEMRMPLA